MNKVSRGRGGGGNEGKRAGGKGPESTLEKLGFWYPSDLGTVSLKALTSLNKEVRPSFPKRQ